MRRDQKHFRLADAVRSEGHIGTRDNVDGSSQSGHERDHFFLSLGCGDQFEDVSFVSGLDDPADGRSFVLWDFNQDGWQDLAVVNANNPKTRIYRNDIGTLPGAPKSHAIAIRLVGGNRTALASPQWSNRDGVGAQVRVEVGSRLLARAITAGEGRAAQNSALLLVGIGETDLVDRLEVRWPSGRVSVLEDLPTEQLVTVFENSEESGPRTSPYGHSDR